MINCCSSFLLKASINKYTQIIELSNYHNNLFTELFLLSLCLYLFASAKEVVFSIVSICLMVGLFVNRIKQQLLNRFSQNLVWGWDLAD